MSKKKILYYHYTTYSRKVNNYFTSTSSSSTSSTDFAVNTFVELNLILPAIDVLIFPPQGSLTHSDKALNRLPCLIFLLQPSV